jgi:putative DNA methylase
MTPSTESRLIETDAFPFEFLSRLAERESWRKELHRPVYHVHKWWANRLGSVFRGILLGCALPRAADLQSAFYRRHAHSHLTVLDPFMGSGTTIGEAHKLGFTALGRDINPVAVEAVRTSLGPLDGRRLRAAFDELSDGVGRDIRKLYLSHDDRAAGATGGRARSCEVLYYFWVMQVDCPDCRAALDLFPSYVIARNAFPDRNPAVQIVCPGCGDISPGLIGQTEATCRSCKRSFDPTCGTARGRHAVCPSCECEFTILDAVARRNARPNFRLYGKLVLTRGGGKKYLPATDADRAAYARCCDELQRDVAAGALALPDLALKDGHNTRQAMGYAFHTWRDFFNDRQLLALGRLRRGIEELSDPDSRRALLTLFSGALEFNNLFASYKGEGTGAVRHMFSHHILKPERTPIEANLWGTPKSSGSFSGLFRMRLLRALDYRDSPTELNGRHGAPRVCSPPFSGRIESHWPREISSAFSHSPQGRVAETLTPRGIYLSCGDSAVTGLPSGSVDFVVTDPPFFDNVHYSELADFFYAWQQLSPTTSPCRKPDCSTRTADEVQDTDADRFSAKLRGVFRECARVLKDDGLLVFTYHHSRAEGWRSLAEAILGAGFRVANSHPVKAEMSVATPKTQAKEPIQLDVIVVCRKQLAGLHALDNPVGDDSTEEPCRAALDCAHRKLQRLREAGFRLSRNDRKIVILGQLLTTISAAAELDELAAQVEMNVDSSPLGASTVAAERRQRLLF